MGEDKVSNNFTKGILYSYKEIIGSYIQGGFQHGYNYSIVDDNGVIRKFQKNSFYYNLFKW